MYLLENPLFDRPDLAGIDQLEQPQVASLADNIDPAINRKYLPHPERTELPTTD